MASKRKLCPQPTDESVPGSPAKRKKEASAESAISPGAGEEDASPCVPTKARSQAWSFFRVFESEDTRAAICSLCHPSQGGDSSLHPGHDLGVYKYTGSPTNLMHHLRSRHGEVELDELPTRKMPKAHTERLNRAFVRYVVAGCGLPFRSACWEPMRCFMAELCPAYPPMGQDKCTSLFTEYARHVQQTTANLVRAWCEHSQVTMIADAWEAHGQHYVAVMVTWIDEAWQYQQHCIAVKQLGDTKDHVELGEKFVFAFKGIGLDIQKHCWCAVVDNEGAGLKALRGLDVPVVRCSCHTIQLAVRRALFYEKSRHAAVWELCEKLRSVVKHLRFNPQARKRLSNIQASMGRKKGVCIVDADTRWSSTLHMLDRAYEERAAIDEYRIQYAKVPEMSPEDWRAVRDLAGVLQCLP